MKSPLQRALLALAYGPPRKADGKFDPARIRKILLIRRNGLGDMICALPLLRSIHAAWPRARLDVLAGEKNACILEGLPFIGRVHLYRRGRGLFRNHYLNLPRVLAPIRAEHYDLLIAVKAGFSPLLGIIAHATRIPWRLGYVPSRGHPLDFCFNLQIELPAEREHQIESCLRFLEPLGIPDRSRDLDLNLLPANHQYAEEIMARHQLAPRRWALFNISSERHESRWTPAAVASVAREIEKRLGLPTLLCGLPRDHDFAREALRLEPAAIRDGVEPPDIRHFAALAQRARFLVCGDGGPMHVAAAVKTPVFVLFSATDPHIWKPYGVPFDYIQRGRFVTDIPPADVAAKICQWISEGNV